MIFFLKYLFVYILYIRELSLERISILVMGKLQLKLYAHQNHDRAYMKKLRLAICFGIQFFLIEWISTLM